MLGELEACGLHALEEFAALGGHRTVHVDDDLGVGVRVLHLFDEGDIAVDLAQHGGFVLLGETEYEGVFRDDVEFLHARSKAQDLRAGLCAALVHALQLFVVAAFGTEEDHPATGFAHQRQTFVCVLVDGVDATLAPPAHVVWPDQLGKLHRALLAHEEVVVVELDGIRAPALFDAHDVGVDPIRAHPFPTRVVDRHHGAEATGERAAEAAVVGDGPLAEKGFAEVFLQRVEAVQVLIRQRRQSIQISERCARVAYDGAFLYVDQILDRREVASVLQRAEKFRESVVAHAIDHEIDEAAGENTLVLVGGEVAAPDHSDFRKAITHQLAKGNGLAQLRAGHYGTAEVAEAARCKVLLDHAPRILFAIPVHEYVLTRSVDAGPHLKDRVRDAELMLRTSGIEENDSFAHGRAT